MDIAEATFALDARLGTALSEKRAAHSRRVADKSAELCAVYGLDPAHGRLAGLAHDICRGIPLAGQRLLAGSLRQGENGEFLTAQLLEDPELADAVVHGPAAAQLLREEYGIQDAGILEAVALHSLGDPGMGSLAAVVFIADKTEPGRGRQANLPDPASIPLRSLLSACIASSILWLETGGAAVARRTLRLYNSLKTENFSQ